MGKNNQKICLLKQFTTITSKLPFGEGIRIIKIYSRYDAVSYPSHSNLHLTGGDDLIPLATTLQDGDVKMINLKSIIIAIDFLLDIHDRANLKI